MTQRYCIYNDQIVCFQAKLLMSQKLVQFRGLCDKNIAAMDPDAVPDPFVPTSGDLAGFWDMVYIQVMHTSIATPF